MAAEARSAGYTFPYLYDESQAWPAPTRPPARRISSCSTPSAGSSIGGSLMTAARATGCRSQAATCGGAGRPPGGQPVARPRSPAWAATSSGSPARSRITDRRRPIAPARPPSPVHGTSLFLLDLISGHEPAFQGRRAVPGAPGAAGEGPPALPAGRFMRSRYPPMPTWAAAP